MIYFINLVKFVLQTHVGTKRIPTTDIFFGLEQGIVKYSFNDVVVKEVGQ